VKGQRPGEKVEGFIERLIREAQEAGEFDRLPGAGRPLPFRGEREEAWWIKEKLRREKLSALPDALAIRHDAEALVADLARIGDERVVRERLEAMNVRIRRLNATVVAGPPTTLAPFDVEATVSRWRRGDAARASAAGAGPQRPADPRSGRR
jgi:hypothetical protein